MTTSATGGYLVQTEASLPGNTTLLRYIQQIIVGLTGLDGTLVRPKWQKNPPKVLPNPEDNYCTFGVSTNDVEAGEAYVVPNEAGSASTLQRHEELTVLCSFYGSDCQKNAGAFRDAFQISQNRDTLKAANMGFKETSAINFVPEIHGQVWFPRADVTVILRRQIDRTFAVLSFEGSSGTIKGLKDNDETENVLWNVSEIP